MTTSRIALLVLAAAAIASPAKAATSSELLKCQKAIESNARTFVAYVANKAGTCADKVIACQLANEIDAVDPTSCLASASTGCAATVAQVAAQQSKRNDKVTLACGLIPFNELQQFVAGLGFFNVVNDCAAANVNDLVDCLFEETRCNREKALYVASPRAQAALTAAGVAASYPCVAP